MPRLLVVIVNYRTGPLVVDCLASLEAEVAATPARVVVVDNASGDGSGEAITSAIRDRGWDAWASVQLEDANGGFAAGNNAAIRPALASAEPPDFVWLLNPDTVVRPGALASLLAFLREHPGAGLAGSRLEDPDGTPQRSAFRYPSVLSELEHGMRLGLVTRLLKHRLVAPPVSDETRSVGWVAGASLLIRREVFDAIGLLDDRYFMYFEEVDFCNRARKSGWPCWYVPGSRVVHLVGMSSGVTNERGPRKRRPAYWFEARRRYFLSHLGRAGTLMADLAWSLGYASFILRSSMYTRPNNDPPHLFSDFLRHNFLPAPPKR